MRNVYHFVYRLSACLEKHGQFQKLGNIYNRKVVPGAGLEPARSITPRDFKSLVSTNFTTRANPYASRKELGSDDAYYIKFDRRA